MRRPGAPALRRFHRGSRLLRTPSLWKAGRQASVASSGTGPVFTMAHPSFGSRCPESAEFSQHRRKSPTAQSLQDMERLKQDQPEKPRRHHADACTILGHVGQAKNGICRAVHSRKGSADPRRNLLSPIPICRRQAFMCAISPKASFPPAVSVARYRQMARPQASPSSAWCRFPVCACFLASLKRRICCTYIRTGTASQCCVSIFAHAHPLS